LYVNITENNYYFSGFKLSCNQLAMKITIFGASGRTGQQLVWQAWKTNYETLSSYIGYLKDTFVIHQVERYNLRGKQVLGGEYKYYLNDLAFKNFLFGFFPEDIGYNLENYIYIQLRRMGYKVRIGLVNNLEVDFVAEKPGKKLYVQVCYMLTNQKVIDREFGNLLQIKDNHEKVVVSLDEIKFSDYEGIRHVRPWELV
jgi:uncharacterized protein